MSKFDERLKYIDSKISKYHKQDNFKELMPALITIQLLKDKDKEKVL